MPYLKIQTNVALESGPSLLAKASRLVAGRLGKPERYVMVALEPATAMSFAGTGAPLAYLELKSIGLPRSATAELSQALCTLMHEELNISPDRVYIEFSDCDAELWGWDSATF